MKLDKAIQDRKSSRSFSRRKVKDTDILDAIDAALQAPAAGNINNVRFIIVSDQNKKNEIFNCCQQDFVAAAPYVVVVVSDYKHLETLYDERAETYAKQQIGAAIENFLLKITDLGLASCWIGAFTDDDLKTYLRIPKTHHIEAILPVGYGNDKKKRPKKPGLKNAIFWDQWNNKKK